MALAQEVGKDRGMDSNNTILNNLKADNQKLRKLLTLLLGYLGNRQAMREAEESQIMSIIREQMPKGVIRACRNCESPTDPDYLTCRRCIDIGRKNAKERKDQEREKKAIRRRLSE